MSIETYEILNCQSEEIQFFKDCQMTRVFAHPVNTNISANIGPILGRQHNCRHCWPDNNRYRAIIGPMLTEFNIICADNSTADADEISETDIGPISAHCRHVCCCPNIGIQYWPDIGSFSEVLILAEYWHTISARYWLIVYTNDHLYNRLNSGIQYRPDIGSLSTQTCAYIIGRIVAYNIGPISVHSRKS